MQFVIYNTALQKVIEEGGDVTIFKINFMPLIICVLILWFIKYVLDKYAKMFIQMMKDNTDRNTKIIEDITKESGIKKHE